MTGEPFTDAFEAGATDFLLAGFVDAADLAEAGLVFTDAGFVFVDAGLVFGVDLGFADAGFDLGFAVPVTDFFGVTFALDVFFAVGLAFAGAAFAFTGAAALALVAGAFFGAAWTR